MQYFGTMLETHISIFQSQLSFDPTFLHNYYAMMVHTGEINNYIPIQWLDYGFMLSYGLIGYGLVHGLITQTRYFLATKWKHLGMKFKHIAIFTPLLDAIENIWLLSMLYDPITFPDYWAIFYSLFALMKWILGAFLVLYSAFLLGIILKNRIHRNNKN